MAREKGWGVGVAITKGIYLICDPLNGVSFADPYTERTNRPFCIFWMPFLSVEQPKYANDLSPRQQASSVSRHCRDVFGA